MFFQQHKHWMALITLLAFLWTFQISAFPVGNSGMNHSPDKPSEISESHPDNESGAIEKSAITPIPKKRRFPWLLVSIGVLLAGAAAFYFLVYQKKESNLEGDHLQLEWLLNNSAQDSSSRGRHGALFNVASAAGHTGAADTAFYFNGTDACIEGPSFTAHENNCLSISLWVKIPAANARTQYFTAGNGFGVTQKGSNISMAIHTPLTNSASCTVPINSWVHIAGTYDGTAIRIYCNGILMKTTSHPGSPSNNNQKFTLGRFSTYWEGYIDDVRIYNCKLSDKEVQTLAGM